VYYKLFLMSYADIEMKVVQWGEKRGIVQNSSPYAQAKKTQEELNELLAAIRSGDRAAMADAYGDILVTLVMGCACADLDLVECFKGAYEEIKDRKGYLGADGIFVKEV
jgi:NTP pyrophosphatase (non-canonical NTP hydrolase)